MVDPYAQGHRGMRMPYLYHAYGFRIYSERPLPELNPLVERIEEPFAGRIAGLVRPAGVLDVRWGRPMPVSSPSGAVCQVRIHDRYFDLWIEHVAHFSVRDGKRIRVKPDPGASDAAVRLYLLGSVLGAALHQRAVTVLHGSAVQTPAGAVVFVAPPGGGKSTLAFAMQQAGYPVLTDDLCVVFVDPQLGPCVRAGAARVKLHADAAHRLGLDFASGVPLGSHTPKRAFALAEDRRESQPLLAVYELAVAAVGRPQIQSLSVAEQVHALVSHTYRRGWFPAMGSPRHHFRSLVSMAERTAIARLVRPEAEGALDDLVTLVKETLNHGCSHGADPRHDLGPIGWRSLSGGENGHGDGQLEK